MTISAYAQVGREAFEAAIQPHMSLDDVEFVMAAYALSKGAHHGVTRADGTTRYFEHPKSVAWILVQAGLRSDREILAIALLHDVLEDTYLLTPKRIEINFGIGVRQGVLDVTIDPKESHAEFVERLLGEHTSYRSILVKLADRLHNLRTLGAVTEEKRRRKSAETTELYLPRLAEFQARMPSPALKVVAAAMGREITSLCEG